MFLDFVCGFFGSMYNVRVLRRSVIFRKVERGEIFFVLIVYINGRYELRSYFVGDSVYLFSSWLMKLYSEGIRDRNEIKFNKEFFFARVKVECVFGLFKSRWRVL